MHRNIRHILIRVHLVSSVYLRECVIRFSLLNNDLPKAKPMTTLVTKRIGFLRAFVGSIHEFLRAARYPPMSRSQALVRRVSLTINWRSVSPF